MAEKLVTVGGAFRSPYFLCHAGKFLPNAANADKRILKNTSSRFIEHRAVLHCFYSSSMLFRHSLLSLLILLSLLLFLLAEELRLRVAATVANMSYVPGRSF